MSTTIPDEPPVKPPLKYTLEETLKMVEGTRYYPARCKKCGSQGPSNLVMDVHWCQDDCDVSCSCCGSQEVDEWCSV